jgi:hypothetical protein
MPVAVEYVRRMRGGAQSHLLRCEDDHYYIVKFQNNPQGVKILANELLGTRLAARLGLPVPAAAVVEVSEYFVKHTQELNIQLARSRTVCKPGPSFGSRYPGHPASVVVYDFLPEEQLRAVQNISAFAGMLAFDKWTCNTNGRQAVFFKASGRSIGAPHQAPSQPTTFQAPSHSEATSPGAYQALMIDQGFCFNAADWGFPDAPLRGIYIRERVYETVTGMESFDPWLGRIEQNVTEAMLEEAAGEIPPQWYNFESDSLYRMLEMLYRRRTRVRDLLDATRRCARNPFPYWT